MTLGPLTLPLLAMLIGAVAWPGQWGGVNLMPLSLLVPALWVWSPGPWRAALVGAAYHLAASRGLPEGAATYFESGLPTGVWLWLVAGLLLGWTYGLLWTRSHDKRLWRIPLLLFLLAVPPLGIIGWSHPLTAAGSLFPASGWWGLAAALVLILFLADLPKPRAALWVLGVVACLQVALFRADPAEVPHLPIQGIDTHLDYDTNQREPRDAYLRQYRLFDQVIAANTPMAVLPESAAGHWDAGKRELWHELQGGLGHRTVLIGGSHPVAEGQLENVLIQVSRDAQRIVYRQRMPVPVAMWRPWAPESFVAAWFANPVFELKGRRAAALICYEHYLLWPVLYSMLAEPELLIGIGNVWWAKHTSLPAIQQTALQAWANLFNVQLVMSFNLGEPEDG